MWKRSCAYIYIYICHTMWHRLLNLLLAFVSRLACIFRFKKMSTTKKPHAVFMPWPAQGHINPLMRFAKLLYSKGFHISFVHTEFNYNRMIRTQGPDSVKGLPDFRFVTMPDGTPPPSNPDATQDVALVGESLRINGFTIFKGVLEKIRSSPDVPPVTCVIGDGVTNFASRAAEELGIAGVQLFSASAYCLIGYLHYEELIKRGIFPFKNDDYLTDGTLDTTIDWVTGMGTIRLRDLPSFFQTTDPNDVLFHQTKEECEEGLKNRALIFNNFEDLEEEAFEALKSKFNYSSVYSVGPLAMLEKKHAPEDLIKQFNPSLWKQDPRVLDWLDTRAPESVLYVNYGCVAKMSSKNFQELAWGIANSKQPFLWIVRPDVVKDGSSELSAEFLEETKERGHIATWCDQQKVLNHPAVGAFLTHCGWNSTTETLSAGKPVICWPFFADQTTNCWAACKKWGIGMEIDPDVKRDHVSSQVKEMMIGEKGKQMRAKAQEWKQKAERATEVGGSSYINFEKVIKEVLSGQN